MWTRNYYPFLEHLSSSPVFSGAYVVMFRISLFVLSDRKYSGQKKRDKKTNNGQKTLHKKPTIEQYTHELNPEMAHGAPEG